MNSRLWYPIGICYVAASLLKAGFEVEIIDIIGENLSREDFKKRLSDCHADSFGIGGLIMAFNNVVDIAQMIREIYLESFIFAGNTVGSTIPEILLHNSQINAIVMGEGEITTVNLIRAVENGRKLEDVKGIVFKNQKEGIIHTSPQPPIENLDDLPYPAWDLVPMNNYFENIGRKVYPISSVRGCPYNCIFCCKTFIGYRVRSRSPESILKELIEVKKRFGIETFAFFDDLFIYNKKRVMKFCALKMESRVRDLEWEASARVDRIDEELCKALSKSHCIELGIGFESNTQQILDFYKKGITVEQCKNAADLCREHGISLSGASFLIGAPDETYNTVKASVDFCKKNRLRYEPHFVTPYPQTALYDYALQKGLIKDELEYVRKISKMGNTNYLAVNLTDNFTDEELYALRKKSIHFPATPYKTVKFYIGEGIKILSRDGPLELINKARRHLPQVFEVIISPIRSPKREKYSNEWD